MEIASSASMTAPVALTFVLDANASFNVAPCEPGALLRATGVPVPDRNGSWQLKPRSAPDVTATNPTVTVTETRALPVGKTVYVAGFLTRL